MIEVYSLVIHLLDFHILTLIKIIIIIFLLVSLILLSRVSLHLIIDFLPSLFHLHWRSKLNFVFRLKFKIKNYHCCLLFFLSNIYFLSHRTSLIKRSEIEGLRSNAYIRIWLTQTTSTSIKLYYHFEIVIFSFLKLENIRPS